MNRIQLRRGVGLWVVLPTAVVSMNFACVTLVAYISGFFGSATREPKRYITDGQLAYLDVLIDLAVGPLLETALFVALPIWLIRKAVCGTNGFVWATLGVGAIAAVLHGLSNPVWGVMAFCSFCGYAAAFQYVRSERSRSVTFINSTLIHSLQNALSVVLSIYIVTS